MFRNKLLLAFSSLIAILVVPYILFAQATPAVTAFTVSGAFKAGSAFTIKLGNVPDLTKLKPTVTLEGKTLDVTSSGTSSITGKLTEGLPVKGGNVKIKYQNTEISYDLYVPYIEKIFIQKVSKGAQMVVSGGNFSDTKCNISLADSDIKTSSCNQRMIFATIGSRFSGGDVTVNFNGLTSAPFRYDYQAPVLVYAENKNGVAPGLPLTIHAKGLSSSLAENLITLDSTTLQITGFKPADGLVTVLLPAENAKGSLKLSVNGIESKTIALDSYFSPILKEYKTSYSAQTMNVHISGSYFTQELANLSVSIGTKTGKITSANFNNIEAEFPRSGYSGCLSVTAYKQTSNCIYFNTVEPPFLKGYDDPITVSAENKYEWTLYAENLSDKNDKIAVYVNGENAKLKGRFLNRIIVRFESIPDKGEVYVVSEGVESNHMPYDFGERFYPFISGVFSNGKFTYGQPIIIKGNNLGSNQFRKNVSVNVSGVALMRDEDTKELDWSVSPSEITVRLDDHVKKGVSATLNVSVKGKKSNTVSFVTGQDSKEVLCSPWIQKIQYPDGLAEGSKIRIQGQCFAPDINKNWIYFDSMPAVQPTYASISALDVKIPKGSKSKGTIKVKTSTSQSNSMDYISAQNTAGALTFSFEKLGTNAISSAGKEGSFARLSIMNTLGEVEMQTLKFKFVYEDDKNNPNSFLKLGPLPLGEIKIAFTGVGQKKIPPAIVERSGTNEFTLTLDGIRISPSLTPQILEFSTTVKSFALNGAKFHMEFDPAKQGNFSGVLIKGDKREILKLKQKPVSGAEVTISQTAVTCFDSDTKNVNCSKPTSPSIPKK